MQKMRKYGINRSWFLCNLLLAFGGILSAQNYVMANKPQLNQKKSLYHLPIGENDYGTYTMNYVSMYLKDGFSLEWYDEDFAIQEDRFIDVPKKTWVLRVWTTDSMVCWLSATKKGRQGFLLYLNRLSYNLKGEIETKLLDVLPLKEINSDDVIVRSHSLDFTFILGYIKKEKRGTSVHFMRFSDEGRMEEHLSRVIPYDINTMFWEDLEFSSNSGNNYLGLLHLSKPRDVTKLYRQTIYLAIGSIIETNDLSRKNRTDSSNRKNNNSGVISENGKAKYDFLNQSNLGDSLSMFETQTEVYLQRPVLSYNPQNGKWIIGGLWGNVKTESLGYWVWEIFSGKTDINNKNFSSGKENFYLKEYEFNTARILDGVIKRKKKVAPENYVTRRMIFQLDGTFVLLIERFVELKQLETYYINGIPQTATKILYNYNEVGVLFVNREMEIDTCLRIDKDQASSPNNAYLLGFGSYVCQSGIHILYNADISKDNNVVDVVIQPDYKLETRTLINSDHVYSVLVPMDGKETNYCSFTVPLLKDKQWFWMKVFDYDK